MMPLSFGLLAAIATMLGGALALRLRDRLHLILGFSAGAVIAVAFFSLLPESLNLGSALGSENIIAIVALGFLLYLLLDRLLVLHAHHEEDSRGHARAGSLSVHSFLDGVGIGLAFHVSGAVGGAVALAVLAHDFSDGINTVTVFVRHGGTLRGALRWLMIDALAPIVGVAATLLFTISQNNLGLLLALFAGFFLYIGASDLIPESHHAHPTFWTTAMTLFGAATLFIIIHFAGV